MTSLQSVARQRGFTLIETMIYLAIFAVVIGGVVVAAYLLFQSSGKIQTRGMVLMEEQFLLGTVERLVGDAASVSDPSLGGSGSTLTLTTFGGQSNTFTSSGTDLQLNGTPLNNTNVTVTDLTFKRSSAAPESITAEFTVSAYAPNGQTVSFSASTTKYLRK